MSTFLDQLHDKWAETWLTQIFDDLAHLHHHREIWRGMSQMILDHPETNTGFFLEAFTKMYVDSQAMGVRRQAETGSTEVISLGRLLTQIRDHPGAGSPALPLALGHSRGGGSHPRGDDSSHRT